MRQPLRPSDILRAPLPLWLVVPALLLFLAAGMALGGFAGWLFAAPGTAAAPGAAAASCPEEAQVCTDFQTFWEVWQIARNNYVDSAAADPDRMIEGAVDGMLDALGDAGHTRYLTAEENADWRESIEGSFQGIGAYIDERDGQIIIAEPIPGSPAAAAGLQPGDRIMAVDGLLTAGWTIDELISRVRGPADTQVTLRIERDGAESFEVTITRARVVVPSVYWAMLTDDVAHIKLTSFDQNAAADVRTALREAQDQGADKIIFDLRNNPGGLLSAMVAIAGEFLPGETPVLLERNRNGDERVIRTERAGVAGKVELVVLINGVSASAAEITAGALQDNERAVLIGETTVGTGTVLTPYELEAGGALLLGTQEWRTPAGRLIRGQGIAPDQQVLLPDAVAPLLPTAAAELGLAALLESSDTQLIAALRELGVTAP